MIYRDVEEKDFKQLYEMMTYYIDNTTINFSWNIEDYDCFIKELKMNFLKYPYIVAVENDNVLGYATAHSMSNKEGYQHSVELSIYLNPKYKHQGIGKNLYHELETKLKRLNINQIYSCITSDNQESLLFHYRLGFEKVGYFKKVGYKFNQWLDVYWLQKTIVDTLITQDYIPYNYEI